MQLSLANRITAIIERLPLSVVILCYAGDSQQCSTVADVLYPTENNKLKVTETGIIKTIIKCNFRCIITQLQTTT